MVRLLASFLLGYALAQTSTTAEQDAAAEAALRNTHSSSMDAPMTPDDEVRIRKALHTRCLPMSKCDKWDHSMWDLKKNNFEILDSSHTHIGVVCQFGHSHILPTNTTECVSTDPCGEAIDFTTLDPPANTCRCITYEEMWNAILKQRQGTLQGGCFLFIIAQLLLQYGVYFQACIDYENTEQMSIADITEMKNAYSKLTRINYMLKLAGEFLGLARGCFWFVVLIPSQWLADCTSFMKKGFSYEQNGEWVKVKLFKAYSFWRKCGGILNLFALYIFWCYAEKKDATTEYVCTCGNLHQKCNGQW